MTEQKRENLIEEIVEGLHDRKARNVSHIDMSSIPTSAVAHFVICEGTSRQHAASIADNLRDYMQEHFGVKPFNYTGSRGAEWTVIDYGEAFVHVFAPQVRSHYDLEELWSDGIRTDYADVL